MLRIIFPRGAYGHHLAHLLCIATNLSSYSEFFTSNSDHGDSHFLQEKSDLWEKVFSIEHFKHLTLWPPKPDDKFIFILPHKEHLLDYLDNSFIKESKGDIVFWINERLINREKIPRSYISAILEFMENNKFQIWDFSEYHDIEELWKFREFLSFKIEHLFFALFNRYFMLQNDPSICTVDLFENFLPKFEEIVPKLKLEFKLPLQKIVDYNNMFVSKQIFHGMQKKCDQFVESIILSQDFKNPCLTIWDEAYVQWKLRERGYKLNCVNLNVLPVNASDFSKLLNNTTN